MELHFSHSLQHLSEFGQSLFAFVDYELRPVYQLFIYLFERLLVVLVQLHFLPELAGSVSPLSCLHIEVADPLLFPDCGVLRISQRAGPAIAQPSEIVLVSAEVLRFSLDSEGAVFVVDHRPNHLVYNHFNNWIIL